MAAKPAVDVGVKLFCSLLKTDLDVTYSIYGLIWNSESVLE